MPHESTDLLALARGHHDAGRLSEAEQAYRAALARAPREPDALQGLGLLAWQAGRPDEARPLLRQAAALAPQAWRHVHAFAVFLGANGPSHEALAAFEQSRALAPGSAPAWRGLAEALRAEGRLDEAVAAYEGARARAPADAGLWNNLGLTLDALGSDDQALAAYREGLALDPRFLPLHNNLGNALLKQGRIDAAIAAFRQALAIDATAAEIWFNLGNACAAQSAGADAIEAYQQALARDPAHARAWVNLGNVLRLRGELPQALAHYERALALQPGFYDARVNAGIVLHLMGRLDEAMAALSQAIESAPGRAEAHVHLGNACKDSARLDEAVACYRRAMALDPASAQTHGNLLYALHFQPGVGAQDLLREARAFGARHGHVPRCVLPPRRPADGRRLRIGYVSPDFRNHCQSNFTLPLLAHHDHRRFEIHAYAHLARPDGLSERLAGLTDAWHPIYGRSDAQVADLVVADGIDILVDLTMHMSDGRPLLFARRPAPIQVAWLAYPGTTGIPAMDYRVTDPWLDPPAAGNGPYTETTVRLPDTFWCYTPLDTTVQPGELPAMRRGGVTFGCLNNYCKISEATLALWAAVMARLPSSRLLLLAQTDSHRQRVLACLGAQGIAPQRIEFVGYQPRQRYLETYHRIDICLDTLPYNGHTTSIDACWMGVPVVTRVGDTVVGRAGWSQLNNLGLPELAAFEDAAFVDIACALATDLPRLARLRAGLRARLEASPLMDGPRFARAMEALYDTLWKTPLP